MRYVSAVGEANSATITPNATNQTPMVAIDQQNVANISAESACRHTPHTRVSRDSGQLHGEVHTRAATLRMASTTARFMSWKCDRWLLTKREFTERASSMIAKLTQQG
jgi:hypothetical protein